jgi:phytoene dehydrogenase-like protein
MREVQAKGNNVKEIEQTDAVVVGGGLAGFMAAAKLARAGRSVVVLEQGKQLGGRAATNTEGGVHFNLGPRALYCQGHAFRLLQELDVPFRGALPTPGIALGYYQGREHRLPGTLSSLFWTRLLSPAQKWRLAQLFRELPHLDTTGLASTSAAQWVRQRYGTGALADYLFTSFRLTTYVADMQQLSAGAAIDQLKLGLAGNVWYLDGGWQSLIEGLRCAAESHGAEVQSGAHVSSVRSDARGVLVELMDRVIRANVVVLAIPPRAACETLSLPAQHPLVRWLSGAQPVRAACLDVALAKLPRPQHRFALGVDQPLYFSVHSAAARLAPDGVAVLHVMKYLESRESGPQLEEELQQFLERAQPGWRQHVLRQRFLPSMVVTPDLPQAHGGGLAGRPAVTAAKLPGVFLAGDWVGSRGQLADAAAASAEEAAEHALQYRRSTLPAAPAYA